MLKQLGQVYSVMKIERLRKLVPFMDFGRVEAIIVDAVKNEYIQVSPRPAPSSALRGPEKALQDSQGPLIAATEFG